LIRILKKKHYSEIVEDVEDRIYSFYGSIAHEFLENVVCDSVIYKEQRLFLEVGDWLLSGQFDLIYKDSNGKNVLADIKFVSKYAIQDGVKKSYERQVNIYRYMFEQENKNIKIDRMEIFAFVRDAGWIDDKIVVLPVKKYKLHKVKEYIEKRVAFHKLCEDEIVGKCPECDVTERWQDPEKWAVCPGHGKKSLKNHDTRASAEAHAATKDNLVVEIRPAENKRCSRFCSVSVFCPAWAEFKETGIFPNSYTKIFTVYCNI